jgi:hypothetical protein
VTKGSRSVVGWKLDRDERRALLARFPPRYPQAVAGHVTFLSRVARDTLPPPETPAEIVGHADDGEGVEAMVVAIEGSTDRPDGSTWHVTWSLGPGREAKESNEVIAARGWIRFEAPVPLTLIPARWP